MYCGKCGKKIESTAGVCYSCTSDPVFDGPVFPCPQCARIDDTSGLARVIEDAALVGGVSWMGVAQAVQRFIRGEG